MRPLKKGSPPGHRPLCWACRRDLRPPDRSAALKRWRQENPDRVRAHIAKWRQGNPDYDRTYGAKWRQENQDKARALSAAGSSRRRARLRNAEVEVFTHAEVFERDRWRCQICGRQTDRAAVAPHPLSPSLDHIVPISLGGAHTRANTQCAHLSCNIRKGNRVLRPEQLRLIG